MNVLFLCTGNSGRSILAEAIFNHLAPAGFSAQSAGSHPVGSINPHVLDFLSNTGLSVKGLRSKSWNEISVKPDMIITVCSKAAGETCPVYLSKIPHSHWDLPNPIQACGGDEKISSEAFNKAIKCLKQQISVLLLELRK